MSDLDELERLWGTATPGPWGWVPNFGPTAIYSQSSEPGEFLAQQVSPADTRLIVEARNQLPALIAELREARATIERVRELLPQPADVDHRFDDGDNLLMRVGDLRAALDGDK